MPDFNPQFKKIGEVLVYNEVITEDQLNKALLELTGILSGTKSYGSENLVIIEKLDDAPTGSQNKITKYYDKCVLY